MAGLGLASYLTIVSVAVSAHPGVASALGGIVIAGLSAALGAVVRAWSA